MGTSRPISWDVEIEYVTTEAVQAPTALRMALPGPTFYFEEPGRLRLGFAVTARTLREATSEALRLARAALARADFAARPRSVAVSQADEDADEGDAHPSGAVPVAAMIAWE